MKLHRVYAMFLRQLFISRRPSRLLNIFYWPTLNLILWGFITVYLNKVGKAEFNFITLILGAVILWNFLERIQIGVSVSFLEDVWSRNFINIFSTPLTIAEYAMGLISTSIFNGILSLTFAIILAWLFFSYNLFQFGFFLIPYLAILFIFGWSLGLFATAIILRFGPSSEVFAWSLPVLITPLAGVFYPVSALPGWLQPVANFLPPAHVFEGMRNILLSGNLEVSRLIVAFLLSFIYLAVTYILLLYSYRVVLRRGLFTRFMTE